MSTRHPYRKHTLPWYPDALDPPGPARDAYRANVQAAWDEYDTEMEAIEDGPFAEAHAASTPRPLHAAYLLWTRTSHRASEIRQQKTDAALAAWCEATGRPVPAWCRQRGEP